MNSLNEQAVDLLKNQDFSDKLAEIGISLEDWKALKERLGQFSPEHIQVAEEHRNALLRLGIDYATDAEALEQHFHGKFVNLLDYIINLDKRLENLQTASFYESVKGLEDDPEVRLVLSVQRKVELVVVFNRPIERLRK